MDSVYLKRNIGEPLAECLAEVAEKKPVDPIEYIGLWLHKFIENREYQRQVKRQLRQIAEERSALSEDLKTQKICKEEEGKIKQEDNDRKKAEAEASMAGGSLSKIIEAVEPQEVPKLADSKTNFENEPGNNSGQNRIEVPNIQVTVEIEGPFEDTGDANERMEINNQVLGDDGEKAEDDAVDETEVAISPNI